MKKRNASKIQYKVFRFLFSRSIRQHKRRVFLSESLVDLFNLCGYSPNQVADIAHEIVIDYSFNPFLGVVVDDFDKYSIKCQSDSKRPIDKIEVMLVPVSLGFFDLFKRDAEYKVKYYEKGKIVFSSHQVARRF